MLVCSVFLCIADIFFQIHWIFERPGLISQHFSSLRPHCRTDKKTSWHWHRSDWRNAQIQTESKMFRRCETFWHFTLKRCFYGTVCTSFLLLGAVEHSEIRWWYIHASPCFAELYNNCRLAAYYTCMWGAKKCISLTLILKSLDQFNLINNLSRCFFYALSFCWSSEIFFYVYQREQIEKRDILQH